MIIQRINGASYQTRAGKTWDKDIYSAWKRRGNLIAANALQE